MNKKDKKHSGRYRPNINKPTMSHKKIKEEALESKEEYDDWIERRDGMRDIDYLTWKKRDKKKDKKKFPFITGSRRIR